MKKTVVFAVAACLLASCTASMMMTIKRPAEINLKGFKKIAIGGITEGAGNHANDISDGITTRLVQTNTFEVLDRQNLQHILDEHKLTLSGIVDQSSAAELGKIIGSAALVFGRVQNDGYKEELTKDDPFLGYDKEWHQYFYRTGTYTLTVHLTVVDIQTSKILCSKDIPESYFKKTSADNGLPEEIDKDVLYSHCLEDLCDEFMHLVAPYDVQVQAVFEKDGDLPNLTNAINQFKIGETDEGLRILDEMAQKDYSSPKTKAKALYNLGLAQLYNKLFDKAADNFKKANSLNTTDRYMNAIVQVKKEKAADDKLKSQGSDTTKAPAK